MPKQPQAKKASFFFLKKVLRFQVFYWDEAKSFYLFNCIFLIGYFKDSSISSVSKVVLAHFSAIFSPFSAIFSCSIDRDFLIPILEFCLNPRLSISLFLVAIFVEKVSDFKFLLDETKVFYLFKCFTLYYIVDTYQVSQFHCDKLCFIWFNAIFRRPFWHYNALAGISGNKIYITAVIRQKIAVACFRQ